jgi:hypothetical protein
MSVHEMPGAKVSRRMLAEAHAKIAQRPAALSDDYGLADCAGPADILWPAEPPDDSYAAEMPPSDTPPGVDKLAAPELAAGESLADLYRPIDWRELWATTSAGADWLVPDILERGRLHSIYAPKKHKKSLLTLVMVAELATGRALLGRPNPHGCALRVLYIDIENARDDIRQRLQDADYGPDDLTDLIYFSFPGLPGLDSSHGAAHLLALVERHEPDLLVLDTTSRVVTGKENDADTFRALYRHALAPIKAMGITVLRLDHAGKDIALGQRGSSAKGDDLDTAWLVSIRDDTRLTLRLDFQRTNHHPEVVELVQRGAPLRFVRLDHATDRPEVATLLAELDRLQVPDTTGRPAAAKALRENGIRFTDNDLETAIKIRKAARKAPAQVSPKMIK